MECVGGAVRVGSDVGVAEEGLLEVWLNGPVEVLGGDWVNTSVHDNGCVLDLLAAMVAVWRILCVREIGDDAVPGMVLVLEIVHVGATEPVPANEAD